MLACRLFCVDVSLLTGSILLTIQFVKNDLMISGTQAEQDEEAVKGDTKAGVLQQVRRAGPQFSLSQATRATWTDLSCSTYSTIRLAIPPAKPRTTTDAVPTACP